MRIDHVIVTTLDLDGTAEHLVREHGLPSVEGGRHEAWGTANRLIPAGSSYVELMGVGDEAVARQSQLGRFVLASAAEGARPVAVCLTVESDDELAGLTARLGLEAQPGGRARPDGSTVSWRLVAMQQAFADRVPFFIRWDAETGAQDAAAAGSGATAIAAVRLGGDPDRMRVWVGEDVPGLEYVGGAPGVHSIVLDTPAGPVALEHPVG